MREGGLTTSSKTDIWSGRSSEQEKSLLPCANSFSVGMFPFPWKLLFPWECKSGHSPNHQDDPQHNTVGRRGPNRGPITTRSRERGREAPKDMAERPDRRESHGSVLLHASDSLRGSEKEAFSRRPKPTHFFGNPPPRFLARPAV